MSRRWILFSIILLGTLLRGLVLFKRGSFEFDEAFSTYFAAMDLNALWAHLRFENNPPGYFILLHFWLQFFGHSDLVARSFSMLFGIAAIPLIYLVGVRLFPPLRVRGGEEGLRAVHNPPQPSLTLREGDGRTVGMFSAFLLAISTLPVFYSTETRMYSLYLFLTLLTVWLFVHIIDTLTHERYTYPRSRISVTLAKLQRISFFGVLTLLVWTHITAWMIILALGGYLLWRSKFNVKQFVLHNSYFIILSVIAAFSLLPWLTTFASEKFGDSISSGYLFYIPPDRNYFISILETFLVFGQHNAFIVTLLSAVSASLLFMALRRPWSRTTWFLASWLFIPLLIGFIFSNAVPRYFIAVAPAFYLLLGVGFSKLVKHEAEGMKHGLNRSLCIILIGALILTAYTPLLKHVERHWDSVARWVAQESSASCFISPTSCLIIVHPHSEALAFERYYRGKLPVVGFYPEDDLDSRDLRIVKTNWKNLVNEKNIRALADKMDGYDKVFLIFGETDRTSAPELVSQWFWENGWVRKTGTRVGPLQVITLVKEI